MRLPFAPDAKKQYAPAALCDAISTAGWEFDDVAAVYEADDAWVVTFVSDPAVNLRVPR